jgi:hypothetical protein
VGGTQLDVEERHLRRNLALDASMSQSSSALRRETEWRGVSEDYRQKGCGLAETILARRKPGRMTEERANSDKSLLKVIAEGLPRTKRSGSSGGAVVTQAAARSPAVRTVLTLATQHYQVEQVAQLVPRCSILLPP